MKKFKDPILQQAYDYGFDAGRHGASSQNCHFTIFSTREKMLAWSQGNDYGSKIRVREETKILKRRENAMRRQKKISQ